MHIGACYHYATQQKIQPKPLDSLYLGNDANYNDDEIKIFDNYTVTEFQNVDQVLNLILENKILATCRGRAEMGPRSLGNRSILADPRNPQMKNILNEKIKHRESFRPFAPSILEEHISEYFDIDVPSPYMLLVTKVKCPEKIPAVTHVDGTGRLQSVSKNVNSLYYELINEFYKLTDVPVIINTSMNVMGEPIVNTPEQAYDMLAKTDMDYIFLKNFMVRK